MKSSDWVRQVAAVAAEFGGELVPGKTGKSHLRIRLPNGLHFVTSSTPSDWRSIKNLRRDLRRRASERP